MEYNSQKEELTIPEYGRNIQEMIKYAKSIEQDELRQAFIERIIDLMLQMAPQSRNMEDYRDKLWKHVFRIADYDINVTPPNGQKPTKEESQKRPEMIPYPISEARYRHYGHNVQVLIKKALAMEPGEKQDGFVRTILSYMKLAYRTWNKEHYVSDDVIKNDLVGLSNGKLKLDEEESITNLTNNQSSTPSRRPSNVGRSKRGSNFKNRSKGGRGRKNKNWSASSGCTNWCLFVDPIQHKPMRWHQNKKGIDSN